MSETIRNKSDTESIETEKREERRGESRGEKQRAERLSGGESFERDATRVRSVKLARACEDYVRVAV